MYAVIKKLGLVGTEIARQDNYVTVSIDGTEIKVHEHWVTKQPEAKVGDTLRHKVTGTEFLVKSVDRQTIGISHDGTIQLSDLFNGTYVIEPPTVKVGDRYKFSDGMWYVDRFDSLTTVVLKRNGVVVDDFPVRLLTGITKLPLEVTLYDISSGTQVEEVLGYWDAERKVYVVHRIGGPTYQVDNRDCWVHVGNAKMALIDRFTKSLEVK